MGSRVRTSHKRAQSRTPKLDGRRAERLRLRLPVRCEIQHGGHATVVNTTTVNVSGSGVECLVPEPLPVQHPCQVTLSLPTGTVVEFRGAIMHCRRRFKGHVVGVEFDLANRYDDPQVSAYSQFIAAQLLLKYLA